MVVTDHDGWIENITKLSTNATPLAATASPEMFRRVRDVDPLQIGDVMPDYHFTNEMGKAVSLSDYKGQAVAFTFIYSRCPFPTYCPRISSNFKSTCKLLEGMANAPTNWHLLSITIDPQFDTPANLKQYAQHQGADPNRWNFLTGELIDITAIAEQFGLLFWRPEPDKPTAISHNLRTVVLDANGKVYQVLKENEWKPETLAQYLVEAARPQPAKTASNQK
jgi:protein SCO1/2